jgi:hypothetical protein
MNERQSRYKLARQSLLPKFGIVGPDGFVREGESLDTPTPEVSGKKTVTVNTIRREDAKEGTMSMKSTVRSEPTAAAAASQSGTAQVFPHGRWSLFKNPFAKTPRPKPAVEPRQSELWLDSVKPVRNDLTDSDLEVVTANKPPAERARAAGAPVSPPGEPEASGLAWGRIKTQFFGAGKV